jgi:hypothetical protein
MVAFQEQFTGGPGAWDARPSILFGALDVCYGTNDGAFHGIGAVAMAMVLGLLAVVHWMYEN